MKRISIIAVLMLATVAIVSCIPKSGENRPGQKTLKTIIQVDASEDLLAACDIEITYRDKGGVEVTDTITETNWKKRIFNDSFPTIVALPEYRLLVKPDAKFDKDRCDLKLSISYMDKILQWSQEPISADDIASSKIASYLKIHENVRRKYNEDKEVLKVFVNKDGKLEYDNVFDPEQSQESSK